MVFLWGSAVSYERDAPVGSYAPTEQGYLVHKKQVLPRTYFPPAYLCVSSRVWVGRVWVQQKWGYPRTAKSLSSC